MDDDLDSIDFGPCCACGREDKEIKITNLIMIEQKGPTPGRGWGCVVCNLPAEGALAVVCATCLDLGKPIRFAVAGDVKEKKRVPVESLGAAHNHDQSKHPELQP